MEVRAAERRPHIERHKAPSGKTGRGLSAVSLVRRKGGSLSVDADANLHQRQRRRISAWRDAVLTESIAPALRL
jgi:hypothetical protein